MAEKPLVFEQQSKQAAEITGWHHSSIDVAMRKADLDQTQADKFVRYMRVLFPHPEVIEKTSGDAGVFLKKAAQAVKDNKPLDFYSAFGGMIHGGVPLNMAKYVAYAAHVISETEKIFGKAPKYYLLVTGKHYLSEITRHSEDLAKISEERQVVALSALAKEFGVEKNLKVISYSDDILPSRDYNEAKEELENQDRVPHPTAAEQFVRNAYGFVPREHQQDARQIGLQYATEQSREASVMALRYGVQIKVAELSEEKYDAFERKFGSDLVRDRLSIYLKWGVDKRPAYHSNPARRDQSNLQYSDSKIFEPESVKSHDLHDMVLSMFLTRNISRQEFEQLSKKTSLTRVVGEDDRALQKAATFGRSLATAVQKKLRSKKLMQQ